MPIERLSAGKERVPTAEQLKEFGTETAWNAMIQSAERWQKRPDVERDAHLDRSYGQGMLERLKGFHAQATAPGNVLDASLRTLEPSVEAVNPDALARIEEIVERLQTEPPQASGDDLDDVHVYLRRSTTARLRQDPDEPGEPLHLYHVNSAAVEKDIATLAAIRSSFPAGSAEARALGDLIGQLQTYRFLDPKVAIQERVSQLKGGDSYMDMAGKKIGRVALTGILVAGTVIFGSIALVNFVRKFMKDGTVELSIAPFLWGFAAWFVADPGLVNSFFDKDDPIKKDFAEVRRLTTDKGLARLTRDYGIGGPAWADVIDRVYGGDHGNLHTVREPTDEAVDRVANDLSNGNPAVAERLRTMMRTSDTPGGDTHFARFVHTLLSVDREDSREFLTTYVRNDAFRNQELDPAMRITLDRAAAAKKKRRR